MKQNRHGLHKKIGLLTIAFLLFGYIIVQAQAPKPPLPVEFLFGHKNLYFQMVVKKSFSPESKFGFFSVVTYTAPYDDFNNESTITIPVQFNYSLGKGFGIMTGTDIVSAVGMSPIVGPQFNYASKKLLIVNVFSYFINQDNNLKIFGLYEYKPPINKNWTFYSRLQYIYKFSMNDGTHKQSYIYARAGLKKKSFIFGFGANLTQSGPTKHFEDNYGIFTRWEF